MTKDTLADIKSKLEEIHALVKNINTDEEVEKIEELLDDITESIENWGVPEDNDKKRGWD